MPNWQNIQKTSLAALVSLLVVGCASQDDLDRLQSDISTMRAELQSLQQQVDESRDIAADSAAEAQRAAQAAEQAAQASAAASEKADRMYQKSLRK